MQSTASILSMRKQWLPVHASPSWITVSTGEERYVSLGLLAGRAAVIAHSLRGYATHIIFMRSE